MIVRDEGETFLLITQPDHARLAEQIVARMRSESALASADRDAIPLATREHDNGWIEVDAEPTIEPGTGRPRDFMSGPATVKHELWLRGIARAAKTNLRAGALVAEHALTVYSYRRGTSEWESFFASVSALRDDLLAALGISSGESRATFERQYRCVQLGDAFSLHFCNGWNGSDTTLEYQATLQGASLLVSPDPFGGVTVPLRVLGRRLPKRAYRDDGDLRDAVAAATPLVVEGKAQGV
jgi:Protein of unknown function (DUF3891)